MELWRQMDIVKAADIPPITVIGAGGIGSFTVVALAKMGAVNITIWDPDKVEAHNIPNQLYTLGSIGGFKADALSSLVHAFAEAEPTDIEARFPKDAAGETRGIVISGVDSMSSRKEIWEALKFKVTVPLYIEARMGAEVARVHTVNPCDPTDAEWYESTLYDDKDALEAPCTARAIAYTGFMIAALIASQVKKFVMGQELKREIIMDMVTLTLMAS